MPLFNLTNISIVGGVTAVILCACYILIKLVTRNELQKGLDPRIRQAQRFFGGKEVRLVVLIHKDGTVEFENFELIKEIEYAG